MLDCFGDVDFLAKLHCVRQACQVQYKHRTNKKWKLMYELDLIHHKIL